MSGHKNKGGFTLKAAVGAAALLATVALASPASASVITIQDANIPNGENVVLNAQNGHDVPGSNQHSETVFAGQFVLTTNQGTLYAWCVDLQHDFSTGNNLDYQYTTGSLTTDGGGNPLSSTQIAEISYIAWYGNTQLATNISNKDTVAAAVQAEIWDIEYGLKTATSPTSGHPPHTDDPGFAAEMSFLNNLLSNPANYAGYSGYTIADLDNSSGRNASACAQGVTCQTLFVPTGPTHVPEPATLTLFGMGLLGAAKWRKKKAAR